jgi:hypothetical protein
MTDPFDIEAHPPCLMNISTGMHATREVQDYLLSAVNKGEKSAETLLTVLSVPSSWNMDTGIGPRGCERMLSIVTSSLLLAKIRARLKTISPDLHFRDVLAFMCSNVFNFDFEIGL